MKVKKIPFIIKKHGDERIDYYYWMRNQEDPDLIRYIKQENEYLSLVSKNFKEIEDELYNEFLIRIEEEDSSYPFKYGNYYYFYKTFKGKPYKVYYRSDGKNEEVILDLNEIAKNFNYFSLSNLAIEKDGEFIAFGYDIDGSENFRLYLKDLRNNEVHFISNKTFYSIEFFNKHLFFTITTGDTLRPYKVVMLNPYTFESREIFIEKDEPFNVDLYKSKDENYLFIFLHSIDTTEIYYLDKNFNLKLFKERKKNIRYFLEHNDGYFYILTNEFHKNFGIYRTKVNENNLEDVIVPRENIKIETFEVFKNFISLLVLDCDDAILKVEIFRIDNNEKFFIEFPDPAYNVNFLDNYEFETNFLRIGYESIIQPKTIYEYDVKNKVLILRKQEKVNNFKKELYKIEKLFAGDIPITIAYRKDLFKKDGNNILWAWGYGAYGSSIFPFFRIPTISLLDRGIVYAIIHVRGGGEKGDKWHDEGRLLNKKNTIFDFIKACEFLIENKYTSKGKIIVEGVSAGGILVGSVINERPELFKVAIAIVPFVDVLNTMLDPSLPLTILEYEEWGNPEIEEFYYYIKSYSPYDNIKEQEYPHVLALTGFNDPRVRYWEPLKWIAKLRDYNKSNSVIAIKIDLNAGHHTGDNKYRALRERAFIIAFALYFIKQNNF